MSFRAKLIRNLPLVIGAVFSVLVLFGAIKLLDTGPVDDTPKRKQVQQVTLLAPPPPPPPPPKVEEPPEPEVQEEVEIDDQIDELEEVPDAPPMGDLGLDADGSGAGDSFGLIGRKGGRSLLDGDPKYEYATRVQEMIEDKLLDNEDIRKKGYKIGVAVWFDGSGRITRARLRESTGVEEIDNAIVAELTGPDMVVSNPPIGMPQPLIWEFKSQI